MDMLLGERTVCGTPELAGAELTEDGAGAEDAG